jgi:hypothetical protein
MCSSTPAASASRSVMTLAGARAPSGGPCRGQPPETTSLRGPKAAGAIAVPDMAASSPRRAVAGPRLCADDTDRSGTGSAVRSHHSASQLPTGWASARRRVHVVVDEPAHRWPSPWSGGPRAPRMEPLSFRNETRVFMGRTGALHRSSRAAAVLGAGATALTIASLLAIAQTTVVGSANAGRALAATSEAAPIAALDFQIVGGPLEIPTIGVVAPGFDDWYTTGQAPALFSPPAQAPPRLVTSVVGSLGAVVATPPPASAVEPPVPAVAGPVGPSPETPTATAPTATPPQATPLAATAPTTTGPASTPTASTPTAPTPTAPTPPTTTPPTTTPPTTTPPTTTPPTTTTPTTTTPAAASPAPAEQHTDPTVSMPTPAAPTPTTPSETPPPVTCPPEPTVPAAGAATPTGGTTPPAPATCVPEP